MKYTIISVNERSADQILKNKRILKNFQYIDDINFINGNKVNAKKLIADRKIPVDVWNPYDGRPFGPLPGELGIWCSLLNTFDYIIDNNFDHLLVLEDDAILNHDAEQYILNAVNELPDSWDFLSLFYFSDQNSFDDSTDIGKKYIHKSINQLSGGVGFIFSNPGVKKIKKILQRVGIQYTTDCFIFHQSRLGFLNGYSLIPNSYQPILHNVNEIKSVIDPDNLRKN